MSRVHLFCSWQSTKVKYTGNCWKGTIIRVSASTNMACSNKRSEKNKYNYNKPTIVLWQLLDQCLIAAQAVNLKGRYLVGTQVVYSQENLTGNHNSILPTIYIKFSWSVLRLFYTYPNVHALSWCPLLIHHASTSRPSCYVYVP